MSSIIGIALWALIPGFIARKKVRSFAAYYLLRFVLTPLITMLLTLFVKDLREQSPAETATTQNADSHEDR